MPVPDSSFQKMVLDRLRRWTVTHSAHDRFWEYRYPPFSNNFSSYVGFKPTVNFSSCGIDAWNLDWVLDAVTNVITEFASLEAQHNVHTKLRWRLILADNRLGDEGVARLALHPIASLIDEVDLKYNFIGKGGCAALAGMVGGLRILNLSYNAVGETLECLLSSPNDLIELEAVATGITTEFSKRISNSWNCKIKRLKIGKNPLGNDGINR